MKAEGVGWLTDFWVYDLRTGKWELLQAEFPGKGYVGVVAFVKDGKAYVGTGAGDGGLVGTKAFGDFYTFSPEEGWMPVQGLTVNSRQNATAFEADGDVFLCFGRGKEDLCRDVYKLAADASAWKTMGALHPKEFPEIPSQVSSFVLNRGGRDYAFVYLTAWGERGLMYVPQENRWETVEDLPQGNAFFTIDNVLYRLDDIQTFRLVED